MSCLYYKINYYHNRFFIINNEYYLYIIDIVNNNYIYNIELRNNKILFLKIFNKNKRKLETFHIKLIHNNKECNITIKNKNIDNLKIGNIHNFEYTNNFILNNNDKYFDKNYYLYNNKFINNYFNNNQYIDYHWLLCGRVNPYIYFKYLLKKYEDLIFKLKIPIIEYNNKIKLLKCNDSESSSLFSEVLTNENTELFSGERSSNENTDKELFSEVSTNENTDKELFSEVSTNENTDKELFSEVSTNENTDKELFSIERNSKENTMNLSQQSGDKELLSETLVKDNTLLFIDDRYDPSFIYLARLFLYSVDETWNITIFTIEENKKYFEDDLSKIGITGNIITIENKFNNNIEYSNLLKTNTFWKNIKEKNCLLFQYDSFCMKKFDSVFFYYNYIGARWPHKASKYNEINIGNGGTSFRKTRVMEDLINKYMNNNNISKNNLIEDVFFAELLYENNLYNCTEDIADKFSFENIFNNNSCYAHQIYNTIKLDEMDNFIYHKLKDMLEK
jgi:hypothetical protein